MLGEKGKQVQVQNKHGAAWKTERESIDIGTQNGRGVEEELTATSSPSPLSSSPASESSHITFPVLP